jgi:hypoxanthine phosphoribosyltransferase
MGPHPAVAEVRAAVRRCLAEFPAGGLVVAACSGGADSLALAAALAHEGPREGLRAGGVTVDHGLQPGSAERAREVARVLTGLGLHPVACVPATVPGAAGRGGPEAAARQARYSALAGAADRLGATAVLLGHSLDDQAESVLLGLARGSGARSLAGMSASRGRYRRPLLGVSRATLRAACAALGLRAWEGPHNTDPGFARARVRHAALPALEAALGPGVAAALARSASQLRADAEVLDGLATAQAALARDAGGAWDAALLAAQPAAIRTRVLRLAAIAAGCPPGALSARHVAALDALVSSWHGQRWADLPGGVRGIRRCGKLLFTAGHRSEPAGHRTPEARLDASDMGADLEKVLIPADRLQARVAELAAEIDADYAGRDLLLVGVLKGAVMVMADLARAMRLPVEMDWMAVSSYGSGTRSSGVVRILKDLDTDISGRHVLVVEDIVDSGLTLSWLVGNLRSRQPASLRLCVLLRKPDAARMDVDVAYTGFDIGNDFVVGYGLDYAERYRNLRFVGTLAPHVYGGTPAAGGPAGSAAAAAADAGPLPGGRARP